MIISSYNAKYLKLQSDHINELSQDIGDYKSLKITGTHNCGACDDSFSIEIDLENIEINYKVDLTYPVKLGGTVSNIVLQNFSAFNQAVVTLGLDLSYINETCNNGNGACTLENSPGTVALDVKTALEEWFNAAGIYSDITVDIEGNFLIISDLPSAFAPVYANYGVTTEEIPIPFTFGDEELPINIVPGAIIIEPSFFNMSEFDDGIYAIDVKIVKNSGYTIESNCYFLDNTIKCKVAKYLTDIKKENTLSTIEKYSSMVHLMHYGLVNGSNCGCNCADLCKVYWDLVDLLKGTEVLSSNTGCSGCK